MGEEAKGEEAIRKAIMEALSSVKDPEFGVDIVNLGLIYGVDIDIATKKANIRITMTTPTCPFAGQILMDVQEKLEKIEELDEIHVELVWDPPWSADMMSEEAKTMLGAL
ncbi:MAG: metal-sulfur cluster assembly factor [Methanobacteriota archaeon]|nr:MAG: metal-sulfur cluster assembly factor [Euryarchaeota archaeon]